nr:CZB domain-containing protein [Thiobacillaceae bacterium]
SLSEAVSVFRLASGGGHRPALAAPRQAAIAPQSRPRAIAGPASRPALPASRDAKVDFDAIVEAHNAWKKKLRAAIADEREARRLDAEEVCKDDKCALGKWLYGEGRRYESDQEYEQLRHSHADFHLCAADVIRKVQAGDKQAAESVLVNRFFDLSRDTVQHIMNMRKKHCAPAARSTRAVQTMSRADEDEWEEF